MQVVPLIKFGERKEAQNLCASNFEAPKEKLCQDLGHDAGSVDGGAEEKEGRQEIRAPQKWWQKMYILGSNSAFL